MSTLEPDVEAAERPVAYNGFEVTQARDARVGDLNVRRLLPLRHGVQLWVALPEEHRRTEPAFEHHRDLPKSSAEGLGITVFLGELSGTTSPATTFSQLVGAELRAH